MTKRILSILLALLLAVGFLPVTARAAESTIYFRNTENWSQVYAYAWNGDGDLLGAWPGSPMTLVEGEVYRITVPFGTPNIIFTNGSGIQTNDLTVPTDGSNCYDRSTQTWSFYDDGIEDTGTLTVTVGQCTGGSVQVSRTRANPGDTVSLAAVPDAGYRLASWDVRGGSGTPVTVTDNTFVMPQEDVTVLAVFEAEAANTIYFKNSANWGGTIYAYAWSSSDSTILGSWPGTAMTGLGDGLYYIPVRADAVNIIFNNGSGSQTGDLTIPTDGKNLYTGSTWSVYATYTVSAVSADEVMGTVTGGGSYLHGSDVTLTAAPASGCKFTGWQENGETVSTDNPYTFTAEADRTLTAVFEPYVGFDVTVNASQGGTVTGGGDYEQNTTARVTALPAVGYLFTGWQENGETVSTDNPYSFTVTAHRTLTAVFTAASTHAVTFNGTNVTFTGESAATVGRAYTATLTAAEGYVVPAAITVTVGGAETGNYTYQRISGDKAELTIPADALTGSIVITAVGETVSGHLIINRLSHITTDSTQVSVEDNTHYYATLTAEKGYKLPDAIYVTMGGEEVTISSGMLAYNAKTGSITVRFITADVVITAVAVEAGPQASVKFAEGNTVEYAWLSDALMAVRNTTGATVTLLDDLYTIATLEIADAANLTLDLNGRIVDCVKSCNALNITDSTVIINDSGADQTGAVSSVSGTSAVVLNSGSLTVNGGTFGDATGIELLGGSLTLNGGLLCGSQGLMVDGGAEAEINGGTVCGNLTSNTGKGINVKDGTVTVNDGTIGNDKGSYMLYVQKAGVLYVNGGEYKFGKSNGFYANNAAATIVISGGTYTNGIWINRNTIAYYLDEGVSVLDANGAEVAASSKAIAQYVTVGKQQPPAITFKSLSLSLESEVHYNLYFTAENMNTDPGDMGLILWDEAPVSVALDGSGTVLEGALYDEASDRYMVRTGGIPGKMLGDTIYLAVYAKLADGSYLYSEAYPYSAKTYCLKRMTDGSDEKLKALCVALMNYGAAAQTYFDYNTESPMNAEFVDYQHLVVPYAADMMAPRGSVDPAKAGTFGTEKSGFTRRSVSMSADGAFAVNYYFTASTAVETVTFYYWTEEDYAAAQVLTPENATGSRTMTAAQGENQFWANVPGIAAKDLDQSIYACGVYEVDGVTCSTGVFAYSLGYYCVNKAAGTDARLKPMAEATAVYSYYAKAYFI